MQFLSGGLLTRGVTPGGDHWGGLTLCVLYLARQRKEQKIRILENFQCNMRLRIDLVGKAASTRESGIGCRPQVTANPLRESIRWLMWPNSSGLSAEVAISRTSSIPQTPRVMTERWYIPGWNRTRDPLTKEGNLLCGKIWAAIRLVSPPPWLPSGSPPAAPAPLDSAQAERGRVKDQRGHTFTTQKAVIVAIYQFTAPSNYCVIKDPEQLKPN